MTSRSRLEVIPAVTRRWPASYFRFRGTVGKWLCLLGALLVLAAFPGVAEAGTADIETPLSVMWVFSMEPDPGNTSAPVMHSGMVYVSHRGTLHCLDVRTGGEEWDFSPDDGGVCTAPVPYGDLIIVGATDARLYGLNARTGETVWDRLCAAPISPDPLLLDGELMVGAGEMVYSMSPESGDATWVCSLRSSAKTGPVSDGSMLYFLCQDSSVQCVDARAGRYRWRVQFVPGPRTFAPTVGGRRVLLATGKRVCAVSRSGSLAWTAEMPTAVGGTPAVVGNVAFVPCVDGTLYGLYARSGAPRRHKNYSVEGALMAPPAVTENAVALGTADGLVYVLDAVSGEEQWVYRCCAPDQQPDTASEFGVYAPLVAEEGRLYVLVGTGDLYCFTATAPDVIGPEFRAFAPEPGSARPGGKYVEPTVVVIDQGSGVDPATIEATVDGMPAEVEFDRVTGLAELQGPSFDDGLHMIRVTAKDYRGNEAVGEWSFLTDMSLAPSPEEEREWGVTGPGGRRPRGGRGF